MNLMRRFIQKSTLRTSNFSLAAASALHVDLLNLGRFEADLGLFSPADVDLAQGLFKANCGPAAFAAVCRKPVCQI